MVKKSLKSDTYWSFCCRNLKNNQIESIPIGFVQNLDSGADHDVFEEIEAISTESVPEGP